MAERGEDDPEETDGIGESPGGKIFLYCFITYPDLPVAPQDEAGLTKTFQTLRLDWAPQRFKQSYWLSVGIKLI